jgi:hypothetical protein
VLPSNRHSASARVNNPLPAPRSAQVCIVSEWEIPFLISRMAVESSIEHKHTIYLIIASTNLGQMNCITVLHIASYVCSLINFIERKKLPVSRKLSLKK